MGAGVGNRWTKSGVQELGDHIKHVLHHGAKMGSFEGLFCSRSQLAFQLKWSHEPISQFTYQPLIIGILISDWHVNYR